MKRFATWLREQDGRDDPIGDLAHDFIRAGSSVPSSNDYWLFREHFRRRGWHVVRAFAGSWHEYKTSVGRKSLRRHVRADMKPSLRFAVLRRDGFRCVYCGASGKTTTLHVDHVAPVVHGGETVLGNLVTSCQACNLGKGPKRL